LGTAKLGIDNYGFYSNSLPKDKVRLLENSYRFGVHSFDTSPRYGDSEK
jgi:aryl-alcohol dehydrogenase-like predicted oxidoreductase